MFKLTLTGRGVARLPSSKTMMSCMPSDEGGDADVEDEGGAKRKGKRRVISKAFVSSSEGSEDETTERVCIVRS